MMIGLKYDIFLPDAFDSFDYSGIMQLFILLHFFVAFLPIKYDLNEFIFLLFLKFFFDVCFHFVESIIRQKNIFSWHKINIPQPS